MVTGVATAQYRLGWLVVLHYTGLHWGYSAQRASNDRRTLTSSRHPPYSILQHSYTNLGAPLPLHTKYKHSTFYSWQDKFGFIVLFMRKPGNLVLQTKHCCLIKTIHCATKHCSLKREILQCICIEVNCQSRSPSLYCHMALWL